MGMAILQALMVVTALLLPAAGAHTTELSREQRLVGGEINTNFHPFFISVFNVDRDGNWYRETSGVLYDARYVIVAAHSLARGNYYRRVLCGSNAPRSVSHVFKHPNFDAYSTYPFLPNDVAVLQLTTPFSLGVLTACWPATFPQTTSDTYTGLPATAVGWGYIANHDWIVEGNKFRVLSYDQCKQTKNGDYISEYSHLCAVDPTETQAMCFGDAGVPLLVGNPPHVVVGLGSWVSSTCIHGDKSQPGVFTRLANYMSWIHRLILTGINEADSDIDDSVPTGPPDVDLN